MTIAPDRSSRAGPRAGSPGFKVPFASLGQGRSGAVLRVLRNHTALILLVPSVLFMLFIERFLRADVLAKVGA